MIAPIDVSKLSAPAQKIASGAVPPKLREGVARGLAPGIKPAELLALLVLLGAEPPPLGLIAQSTLASLAEPILTAALSSPDALEPRVLDALATAYAHRLDVLEKVLASPRVDAETLERVARTGDEAATELLAINEERMLRHPRLIELVYMNPRARMSTADRLIELASRHGLELTGIPAYREAVQAIEGELIPEPSAEPTPDDILFRETAALAESLAESEAGAGPKPTANETQDAFEEDAEGKEVVKAKLLPLYKRLGEMTASQKVRRAILGTKEERMLLIRERNKVIASAAARSPLLQEPDAVLVARNRNVSEEVLRILGTTPEWLKSYAVKRNLVENSRTPITIATRLISHLRESDLRSIAKSKNVSGAVQDAARRHLDKRK